MHDHVGESAEVTTLGDIFIVGPPRSGTSWLQTVLAEHETIASPPESAIFVDFLDRMYRRWQSHRAVIERVRADPSRENLRGLAVVLTENDMLAWLRELYRVTRMRVLAGKAGSTRLLEKTPDHARCIGTIWRVVPDALVIFLVRDPRDVTRSLLSANRERWGWWAPDTIEIATDLWLRNVRAALKHRDDPRMLTVRYEDLRDDEQELERISAFLGLGPPSAWIKTPIAASPRQRGSLIIGGEATAFDAAAYELDGFSYHDRGEERRLSRFESAYVGFRCRNEMEAFGYPLESQGRFMFFRARRVARLNGARFRTLWQKYKAHTAASS